MLTHSREPRIVNRCAALIGILLFFANFSALGQEVGEIFGNTTEAETLGIAGNAPVSLASIPKASEEDALARGEMIELFRAEGVDPEQDLIQLFNMTDISTARLFLESCLDKVEFSASESGAYVLASQASAGDTRLTLIYVRNPAVSAKNRPDIRRAKYLGIRPQIDLYRYDILNEGETLLVEVSPPVREVARECSRVDFKVESTKQKAGFGLVDAESSLVTNFQYRAGYSRYEFRTTWDNTDIADMSTDRERVTGQVRIGLRSRLKQSRKTNLVLIADHRDERHSAANRQRFFLSGNVGVGGGRLCKTSNGCKWTLTANLGWQEKENASREKVDDLRATAAVSYSLSPTSSLSFDYSFDNDVDGGESYSLFLAQGLGDRGQFGGISFGILKGGVTVFSYLMSF